MQLATIVIQARLGSTRFPRKVLYSLPNGKKIIDTVVDAAVVVDKTILVTPDEELAGLVSIPVYVWKGKRDVLGEFWAAVKDVPDDIVRITADCPLLTSKIIKDVIKQFYACGCDYICNSHDDDGGAGDGYDVEVFTYVSLDEAYHKAIDEYDREHVTPYIRRNFTVCRCQPPKRRGCSVNSYEDYIKVCQIMENKNGCPS